MITKIEIQNYKSIEKLELELGRFNVFIGENGCGKTNILEAVGFVACVEDMENGKLALKGIRVTEPKFFRSGFQKNKAIEDINILVVDEDADDRKYVFSNDNEPYSIWNTEILVNELSTNFLRDSVKEWNETLNELEKSASKYYEEYSVLVDTLKRLQVTYGSIVTKRTNIQVESYIIYAPENYFLRNTYVDSPYLQPLGSKGEGLLKLIKVIKNEKPEEYKEIIENLHLIDWFSDIDINEDSISGTEFKLSDIYLEDGIGGFDIRNANEGFFLLLFYITLFVSDYTPKFFAIDNIDAALNPKLCTKLIEILAELAKKHDKQVLITTQNPAILDGINLNDPEQRLLAVSRNKIGHTRVSRIEKKPTIAGEKSIKLSEQFLRGYIGGLPKNF